MRVLVTNFLINTGSGTEYFVKELCLGLKSRNITVSCFSYHTGPLADQLRKEGIEVVSNLSELSHTPDIIHGHHNLTTISAIHHFPESKGIFLCHDAKAWHDRPVFHPRIVRYCAVDKLCQRRMEETLGNQVPGIQVIGNGVNLTRFSLRKTALPKKPKKGLVFSSYVKESNILPILRDACSQAEVDLTVYGHGVGRYCENPEKELPKYDLVFAKARCAMEALSCGASVILCDTEGLGPLVNSGQLEELKDWNFGRNNLNKPVTTENVLFEIQKYSAEEAAETSRQARKLLDWSKIVDQWVNLYQEVLSEPVQSANQQQTERDSVGNLISTLSQPLFEIYQKDWTIQWLTAELQKEREKNQNATPIQS